MNLLDQYDTIYIPERKEWRKWLEENGDMVDGIWHIFYKKHTGIPSLPYNDAVEEALCFGWIDSLVRRVDDEKYIQKFTPRKPRSSWSVSNVNRVKKMIAEGKMTEKGMELYNYAMEKGILPDDTQAKDKVLFIPDYIHEALEENPIAKSHFQKLAPSYKRHYVGWITAGKKQGTRIRRLKEAIRLLEQGRALGMK
ncbi:MAG: YdeI/OmpD-associated family protein [Bacteroidales bacterium]|nr:YdeI/OmpD-associated family protein [Bacteroidales bacterium]